MTQIVVFTFLACRVVFYLKFFGDIKLRQEDITCQAIGFYLVDNFLNIENRLRNILEERLHFGGSFEIILVVRHPETITTTASDRCFLFFAVFHTQQNIVGIGIFFMEIEGIVGSDEFHPVFFGKLYKGFVYAVFIFLVVAHHLQIEVIAKLLFPPQERLLSLLGTDIQYFGRNFAIHTP